MRSYKLKLSLLPLLLLSFAACQASNSSKTDAGNSGTDNTVTGTFTGASAGTFDTGAYIFTKDTGGAYAANFNFTGDTQDDTMTFTKPAGVDGQLILIFHFLTFPEAGTFTETSTSLCGNAYLGAPDADLAFDATSPTPCYSGNTPMGEGTFTLTFNNAPVVDDSGGYNSLHGSFVSTLVDKSNAANPTTQVSLTF